MDTGCGSLGGCDSGFVDSQRLQQSNLDSCIVDRKLDCQSAVCSNSITTPIPMSVVDLEAEDAIERANCFSSHKDLQECCSDHLLTQVKSAHNRTQSKFINDLGTCSNSPDTEISFHPGEFMATSTPKRVIPHFGDLIPSTNASLHGRNVHGAEPPDVLKSLLSYSQEEGYECKGAKGRKGFAFPASTLATLENSFMRNAYPCRETKELLSRITGVSLERIKAWFQRKRNKLRKNGVLVTRKSSAGARGRAPFLSVDSSSSEKFAVHYNAPRSRCDAVQNSSVVYPHVHQPLSVTSIQSPRISSPWSSQTPSYGCYGNLSQDQRSWERMACQHPITVSQNFSSHDEVQPVESLQSLEEISNHEISEIRSVFSVPASTYQCPSSSIPDCGFGTSSLVSVAAPFALNPENHFISSCSAHQNYAWHRVQSFCIQNDRQQWSVSTSQSQ